MHDMKKKIIIYQMPLFERIMAVFSAIVLSAIPIIGLILGFERIGGMIILLLAMIVYNVFIFFISFKTYICLDVKEKKLIIRENVGLKKEELFLDGITDMKVSEGTTVKTLFTIDINYENYTKKIISWSAHPTCRLAMFSVYKRQTKRLKKFTNKCNEYLKTNKNVAQDKTCNTL